MNPIFKKSPGLYLRQVKQFHPPKRTLNFLVEINIFAHHSLNCNVSMFRVPSDSGDVGT